MFRHRAHARACRHGSLGAKVKKMTGTCFRVLTYSHKIGPTYLALRALYTHSREGSWILHGHGKHRFYSNGRGAGDMSVGSSASKLGNRGMNVFDRKAKRWHKNRSAMASDADIFDYLRDEVSQLIGQTNVLLTTFT